MVRKSLFTIGATIAAATITGCVSNAPKDEDVVWNECVIEQVPTPAGMNSVLACLNAALQSRGEKVTYDYLMGVSGRAFRLQFTWCPSSPHAHCGYNTYNPALKATGYESEPYKLAYWDPKTRKQRKATDEELAAARDAVRRSINTGMPVMMNSEECTLLAGYAAISKDNPTGWLALHSPCGPPPKKGAPYVHPVKGLPWQVDILSKTSTPPDRKELVIESLQVAVKNANTPEYKAYTMGFKAWERWIKELKNIRPIIAENEEYLKKFDTNESAPFEIQLGNAWIYDCLIDARRCAAKYLRSEAKLFDAAKATHLNAAADSYDQVVTALTENTKCSTLIAPYPWMKKQKWTQELRDSQAARLEKALPHERNAIAEIEKALR